MTLLLLMAHAFKAVILGWRVEPSTRPVHPDTSMGPTGMSGGTRRVPSAHRPHGPCGIMATQALIRSELMLASICIWYQIEA